MSRTLPALPTVFRALLGGMKDAYERLGLTVIHSMVWFVLHAPLWLVLSAAWSNMTSGLSGGTQATPMPWLFIVLGLLFTGAFLAAPANAALIHVARLADEDEARVRDFFIGFKLYYWRSVAVYGSWLLLVSFLLGNMAAARRISALGSGLQDLVGLVSLVLSGYALLLLLLLSIYLFPLLVLQQNNWRKVWRKAFLLAMDNGLLSVIMLVLTLILYGVAGATGIFLVLFFPAAIAHGSYLLFVSLLRKYDEPPAAKEQTGT